MHRGYIKLYRAMSDNNMWQEKPFNRCQAWADMLMLTNYKQGQIRARGIPVKVDRGQLGWSKVALAERWGWSRGKVGRFFNELETEHQIEQQNNNITSLITIVNYDYYQSDGTASGATDGQQTDSKRTANGQQTDTNNKDKKLKKLKKLKKKEYISPLLGEHSNIKLTQIEHDKMIATLTESVTHDLINRCSGHIASIGDKYKSHYATLLNWHRRDAKAKPTMSAEDERNRVTLKRDLRIAEEALQRAEETKQYSPSPENDKRVQGKQRVVNKIKSKLGE